MAQLEQLFQAAVGRSAQLVREDLRLDAVTSCFFCGIDEETKSADWEVAAKAFCLVVTQLVGEMMTTAETSTLLYVTATSAGKKEAKQVWEDSEMALNRGPGGTDCVQRRTTTKAYAKDFFSEQSLRLRVLFFI